MAKTDKLKQISFPRMVKMSISWKNQSIKDVVLIDNDSQNLKDMEEYLNGQGLRTHSFLSTSRAISFIEKNHSFLHLVITNNEMPNLTGVELVEAIRKYNFNLPVIITSGNDLEMTNLSIKAQINTHLLRKPFREKALENSINHAVC
jgi:DNA-binding NtrC family response regulator